MIDRNLRKSSRENIKFGDQSGFFYEKTRFDLRELDSRKSIFLDDANSGCKNRKIEHKPYFYRRDHNLSAIYDINSQNIDHVQNMMGHSFSKFKYGDPESISEFALVIAERIWSQFGESLDKDPDLWRLVSPAAKSAPTAAVLLALEVGRILDQKYGIPLQKIQLKRKVVSTGDFGTLVDQTDRERQIFGNFYYHGKSLRKKKVIFIEDALVSGTHYKETQRVLVEAGVYIDQIYSFFIADMQGLTFSEERGFSVEDLLNHSWINSENPERFLEVLKNEDIVVTSRMAKFLLKLPRNKLELISNEIFLKTLSEFYDVATSDQLERSLSLKGSIDFLRDQMLNRLRCLKRELNLTSIYSVDDAKMERFLDQATHKHSFFKDPISFGFLYSLLKYGDQESLDFFADQICESIQANLGDALQASPSRWAVASVGYTTLPGAARVLAERVARRLSLPTVSIEREDIPAVSYGTLRKVGDRAQVVSGVFEIKSALKPNVLVIEDAIVSGAVMTALRDLLSGAGAAVYPYAIIDVDSPDLTTEQRLNTAGVRDDQLELLARIINDPRSTLVARTLKTLLSSSPSLLKRALSAIDDVEDLIEIFNLSRANRLERAPEFKRGFEVLSAHLNGRIRAAKGPEVPAYEPLYIFTRKSLPCLSGVAALYSGLKYGDAGAIDALSEALVGTIKARLGAQLSRAPEGWVIAATHYYRVPNASQILAQRVAQGLGLPLADIRRKAIYEGEFGAIADVNERLRIISGNAYCSQPALLDGRRVIYIDDAFVGGSHLREHWRMLTASGAREIHAFSVVDVADADLTLEKGLNYALVDPDDPSTLLKILKEDSTALITRTVKFLLRLKAQEFRGFIAELSDERLYEIFEAAEVEGYGALERFGERFAALKAEVERRHEASMTPAARLTERAYSMMLFDYDDTLSDPLTPLSDEAAGLLADLLEGGVELGIISLQPIGARGLTEFMLTPLRRYFEAHGRDLARLTQLHLLPSEGVAGYRVDASGQLSAPEYNLGFEPEAWGAFKAIVVDEIGGPVASKVYLRGGYISLHFPTEAALAQTRAALEARLEGFYPAVVVTRKIASDPQKKVLHIRLKGASKAIGREYMLRTVKPQLEARLGRRVPRSEILVAGDRMGRGEGARGDAAMFVHGGVNLALGEEARPGAYDLHLNQYAQGLLSFLSALDN